MIKSSDAHLHNSWKTSTLYHLPGPLLTLTSAEMEAVNPRFSGLTKTQWIPMFACSSACLFMIEGAVVSHT